MVEREKRREIGRERHVGGPHLFFGRIVSRDGGPHADCSTESLYSTIESSVVLFTHKFSTTECIYNTIMCTYSITVYSMVPFDHPMISEYLFVCTYA